jgi:hypothetical protein
VQATLLASESFDYDTTAGGTKLSNTVYQGGTGWGTPGASAGDYTNGWGATAAGTGTGLDLDDANGGLGSSLGETNNVGNRLISTDAGANARSLAVSMPLNLSSGSSYYLSFLARTDEAGRRFRIESSYTTPNVSTRWMPFELLSDGKVKTQGGTVAGTSVAPLWQPGKTYFVVSRFEGGAEASYVKIFDINNPNQTNYLTEVDWDNDADATGDGLTGVTVLDFHITASDPGVEIDELKIGTTYADVVTNYTVTLNDPDVAFAYENFDYTAGSVLAGGTLNGGTGWSSGWQNTTATGLPLRGTDESLWFGNFEGLFAEDGSTMIDAISGGEASERSLSAPINLNNDELYFAALIRGDGTSEGEFVLTAGGSVEASFGILDKDGSGDLDLFVHPSAEGYPTNYVATDVFASGTTYLLVMKRTASDISASLLPGNGLIPGAPATWDVTVSGATGASLDKLKIAVASGSLYIDEIGMGNTFGRAVENLPTSLPFDGIYAYDNFGYEPGTSLDGVVGGLGWSEGWVGTSSTNQNTLVASDLGLSLWFGNTEVYSLDGSTHVEAAALDGNVASRKWTTPHAVTVAEPLYFAALVRDADADTQMRFELARNDGLTRMSVGLAPNPSSTNSAAALFVDNDGAVFPYTPSKGLVWSSKAATNDNNYLIVGKRDSLGVYASLFVGGETNSLVEPATWDVEKLNSTGIEFSMLKIAVSTNYCQLDEVVVGNSFSNVISRLPVTFTSAFIDGVPIPWVLEYWASTNEYSGLADDDFDGAINKDEFTADTVPTNINSVLKGVDVQVSSTNTIFNYQNGGPNADVYVEYREGLVLGSWTPIATNAAPTSTVNNVIHDVSGDTGFYRLRAERND